MKNIKLGIVKLTLAMVLFGIHFSLFAQKKVKHTSTYVDPYMNKIDTAKTVNIVYPEITEREGKGLNIPVPPNEHPRLYFRKSDIPTLKMKMTNPFLIECWEKIKLNAEKTVDGKLPQNGTKSNNNNQVVGAIEAKAFLYAFQNNIQLGKEAVTALINYNNTLIIDYAKQDVCREIGRVILTNALIYDWCYDLIPEQEKKTLINGMELLATKLEIVWPELKQGSVVGHGTEAQLSRDMLACGIATYNEKPEIYKLAAGRIFAEFLPARNFFYPAGYHHQGSAYGPYRFQFDLYFTMLFDKMGYPNVVSKDQAKIPYYWMYLTRPDGQFMRDGDDFNEIFTAFGKRWTIAGLLQTASYYKDPILMGEAIKQKQIGKDYLFDFLLIDPTVPVNTDLSSLPLTKYFAAPLGEMVARTGWGDDLSSNAVVAQMKVGVYNYANHQHLDAGSFQIYYKGPLAVNSGIYQGTEGSYGGEHFKNYYQRSIAHNTMLIYNPAEKVTWHGNEIINDGGQQFPNGASEPKNMEELLSKHYKTGEVLAHDFGPDSIKPEYTYLKGELAEAYSDKVKSFKRSFVFLNMNNADIPAAFIVFDRVNATNKDFKKTWLLHSVEEPIIAENIAMVKCSEKGYNGQLVNTTLLPSTENLVINKVGGKGNEYSVNGKNYPQYVAVENNSVDGAIWRIEVSPKNGANTDNFLNVMQVMDFAAGSKKALKAEKFETEQFVGTKIGDRIVLFSKNGEAVNVPFKLNISGNATTKVMITDIAKGSWTVQRVNNKKKSVGTILCDKNVLYFNASKGNYMITRIL